MTRNRSAVYLCASIASRLLLAFVCTRPLSRVGSKAKCFVKYFPLLITGYTRDAIYVNAISYCCSLYVCLYVCVRARNNSAMMITRFRKDGNYRRKVKLQMAILNNERKYLKKLHLELKNKMLLISALNTVQLVPR